MAPPVFTVGQVIGAADVNSWFVPLAAYKASDTSRSNVTTRSADPDLQLSLAASATYDIRCYISYQTGNTAGIGVNFAFTFTGGTPGGRWGAIYRVSGDTGTTTNAGPAGAVDFNWTGTAVSAGTWNPAATPGDGHSHSIMIEGTAIIGGTAGTLSFSWAQDTSNATALVVQSGSKLIAQRVG
jgi:hypothetical protein